MNDQIKIAFQQGYDAAKNYSVADELPRNPYISTSNCADAFNLGVLACNRQMKPDCQLRKSRGYTWFMAGIKFLVEGDCITQLSTI